MLGKKLSLNGDFLCFRPFTSRRDPLKTPSLRRRLRATNNKFHAYKLSFCGFGLQHFIHPFYLDLVSIPTLHLI